MTTAVTGRQAAFIDAYLGCGNGRRAAISAGYSERSAAVEASRLLKNANVAAVLAERQAKAARCADVTVEMVIARAWAIATDDRVPDGVQVRALELLSKLFPEFSDPRRFEGGRSARAYHLYQ